MKKKEYLRQYCGLFSAFYPFVSFGFYFSWCLSVFENILVLFALLKVEIRNCSDFSQFKRIGLSSIFWAALAFGFLLEHFFFSLSPFCSMKMLLIFPDWGA